jgi:hypothetical protein
MPAQSWVWVNLSYKGDPSAFWEILKAMKAEAEKNGVVFQCERVTTLAPEE